MPSRFLDLDQAKRQSEYRFDFNRKSLAGRVVLIPGGVGGLGAAITALLLNEGALPVVGYRQNRGRALAAKLKEVIPKQQYAVAIQGAIGGKIIARETVSAMRKDVTAEARTWRRSPEPCVPVAHPPNTEMCGNDARFASATPASSRPSISGRRRGPARPRASGPATSWCAAAKRIVSEPSSTAL